MTSIRHNVITGEPVLYAPERAGRPNAFAHESIAACPFCPGNESMTPPEVARIGAGGRWSARAFPNKYPAAPNHEVIVESAEHDARFESVADPAAILRLFIDRYRQMRARPDVAYTSLFKNNGAMAGASIDHIHSQLLGVPAVPPRIAREAAAFAAFPRCPLCVEPHDCLIRETERLTWFAPLASTMPYQQWIVPRRHVQEPSDLDEREIAELAALLQSATAAMSAMTPSYNWSFAAFPMTAAGHLYIDLFPRLTSIAGFELGTQMFIGIVDPAEAARRMRR